MRAVRAPSIETQGARCGGRPVRGRGAGPPRRLFGAQTHLREGRGPLGTQGHTGAVRRTGAQWRPECDGRHRRGGRRQRQQEAPTAHRAAPRDPGALHDDQGRTGRGHPGGQPPGNARGL